MQQVNLGMIGGGTVGSGVFHALQLNGDLMASRIGVKVNVRKVSVKAFDEPRPYEIPKSCMSMDWQSVVADPQVHIVAELVGGTTIARTMILTALKLGKPVVTANKALLSAHGEELFAAARKHGTNLYYEASVCGGIPIIKSLREGFVGNRVTHLYGIVNGTCNYILTRMKLEGADFASVLKDAQAQGYAEAEPSLDIDGYDAQHKIGILASLAHGFWVKPEDIYVEGIRSITRTDIQFANQLGYTIKLLGIIKLVERRAARGAGATGTRRSPAARIQVSVYPTLVPNTHVLASVNHVFNALDLKFGTRHRLPPFVPYERHGAVSPINEVVSRYFVRLNVVDRPGVLAQISAILGQARIGIASMIQPEGDEGASVPLILMLHDAPNGAVTRALKKIGKLAVVKSAPVMIRVENLC
jgi:homoserine dehydrogenase